MKAKGLTVLLVEDQTELAKNIIQYLESRGHVVDYASDGKQGLDLALSQPFDVIILDIMMPKMDGLQVCAHLRNESVKHLPILMLTARDTLDDKVTGFSVGADDYLTKPFALEELEIRCIALSRRHLLQTDNKINIGSLIIDRQTKQVERDGKTVNLNAMNFNILLFLAQAYPQVVSRSELCQHLWGDDPTESDSLRSHIYQLRQAIDKPFSEPLIKTVHGVGFTLLEHQKSI
ncbi:response regulator transcription factor [Pseudoalteromonas sp. C2R02]|uniref:response regulator transcription factor n=1 Tax=Pseudoalteromonas sp. C2R02 TaxID=2841565 RepID=UPI001C08CA57|nr:response regulator transcription factor [Pseudoalteromonas sp. C2R02]MBU2970443.1 response regulator transcription factor [Pseudoalteromonas sp. C2R02]